MDKDRWIQEHERFRVEYEKSFEGAYGGLPFGTITINGPVAQESTTASAQLSSLKAITFPELILNKRHHGRILYGRFCVKPYMFVSVKTVLEDPTGNYGVQLSMYNVLPSTASSRQVEACFPLGMKVAIKEPLYKLCMDGKPSLRVDNPADIVLDKGNEDESTSAPDASNRAKIEKDLETIRCEGNRLFQAQDWDAAVNKYSQCIDLAGSKSDRYSRVVMLAYSNRAEARLRLQALEDALRDADKALELDPKHVKTLVRKGKAAHALGLFEKACTAFKTALLQSPLHADSIKENLKASNTFYKQSQNGSYDSLTDYYSRGCTGDIPFVADFMGPVEIRRVLYGCGRRGLFATRGVKPGELLLVSNPMAMVREKAHAFPLFLKTDDPQDLISELAYLCMRSKRKIAQLYSLATGEKQEMEIPSMELFRPGSEWVPTNSDKLVVDVGLIRNIYKLNSFSGIDQTRLEKQKPKEQVCGLWILPSFANHSCSPNCSITHIGGALFIRAFRDILDGEEMTIPYVDVFQPLKARQARIENWLFTCKCERCNFEESLKPQLSKFSKSIPPLVEEAEAERPEDGQMRTAKTELTKIVHELEKVIGTLESRQQNWIRAAYYHAYRSTFPWSMDENDAQSRILALRVLVDSTTATYENPDTIKLAAVLLWEVQKRYSKRSQTYRLTEDRVLDIYKTTFGKQPNKILHNIIKSNLDACTAL